METDRHVKKKLPLLLLLLQRCFMPTETVRDGEPRTSTSTRTQLLSSAKATLALSVYVCLLFLPHILQWWLPPENVPLAEFMYLVFTRMPGESYRSRLRSLLLYFGIWVFRALINSLVC